MTLIEFQPIGGYECDGDERRRYFQFLNWLGIEVRYAKLYSTDGLHAKTIKAGLLPSFALPRQEKNEHLEDLGDIPIEEELYGGLKIQSEGEAVSLMKLILDERDARLGAEVFERSMDQDLSSSPRG